MFRRPSRTSRLPNRFPRIRGDVPLLPMVSSRHPWFSPHTRGCSAVGTDQQYIKHVFPAYAGMFRMKLLPHRKAQGFPRIRGDVPAEIDALTEAARFSPHTRGCSAMASAAQAVDDVFPAYAGMFRTPAKPKTPSTSFPRIRGDVPAKQARDSRILRFSPHTRGCSANLSLSDSL